MVDEIQRMIHLSACMFALTLYLYLMLFIRNVEMNAFIMCICSLVSVMVNRYKLLLPVFFCSILSK